MSSNAATLGTALALAVGLGLQNMPEGVAVASQAALPYALGFAAGAMIFVVIEELIPECHACGNTDIATLGAIIGFAVMMVLDIALA